MFCSTIIPTIGRSTLDRAVESVLNQNFAQDDFEVIVVNDSGQPIPQADWQRSDRVTLITTSCRERSVARNTGAAIAKGKYLHFLDDDDWLFPGAFDKFWTLACSTDAAIVLGNTLLVDRNGNPLIQLHYDYNGNCFIQMVSGEAIFIGSFMVESTSFFSVGGFNPWMRANEEVDLCRRIALRYPFAHTPEVVACAGIGVKDSSTDYSQIKKFSRQSREDVLNAPNAFKRMLSSANDNYWNGCIVRIYLTSAIWNLQYKRPFTAASRIVFGLACFLVTARYSLSINYWRALLKRHASFAFSKGFECKESDFKALGLEI